MFVASKTVLDVGAALTTVSDVELAMHGVYVAWASSDLPSFTPASAPILGRTAQSTQPTTQRTTSTHSTQSAVPRTSTHTSKSTATSSSNVKPVTSTSRETSASPAQLLSSTLLSHQAASKATVTVTSSPTHHPPHGLSVGAKAGIGVSVTIAGLASALFGLWAVLRRRKHQVLAQVPQSVAEKQASGAQAGLFEEDTRAHKRHVSELSSVSPVSELRGSFPPMELDAKSIRAELGKD